MDNSSSVRRSARCGACLIVRPNLGKSGWHILVLADEDQALAAKPRFHREPPQGGGTGVMSIRRDSDHLPKVLEQQLKNGVALAFGPAPLAGALARLKKIFCVVGFKLPVVASSEVGCGKSFRQWRCAETGSRDCRHRPAVQSACFPGRSSYHHLRFEIEDFSARVFDLRHAHAPVAFDVPIHLRPR